MKLPKEYTFNIVPRHQVKQPRKGAPVSIQYKHLLEYMDDLKSIAKAKRFEPGDAMKIIFIIPMSSAVKKTLTLEEEINLVGQPHQTGGYTIERLIKPVREALFPNGDVYRIDAAKYWGDKGCVIIRNIEVPEFDYLKLRL